MSGMTGERCAEASPEEVQKIMAEFIALANRMVKDGIGPCRFLQTVDKAMRVYAEMVLRLGACEAYAELVRAGNLPTIDMRVVAMTEEQAAEIIMADHAKAKSAEGFAKFKQMARQVVQEMPEPSPDDGASCGCGPLVLQGSGLTGEYAEKVVVLMKEGMAKGLKPCHAKGLLSANIGLIDTLVRVAGCVKISESIQAAEGKAGESFGA